jgi:PilZ domain
LGNLVGSPSDLSQAHNPQRTVPRYTFVAVAEITEVATKTCISGRITEISRKGCYIDTLNPLPINTPLAMVICRDGGSFATKGKVIYIHAGIGMGVAFLESDDDQLQKLDSWLAGFSPSDAL